ncbi:MAG: hypothetical protein KAT05_14590, partial [Spirochaetes bacterium]|nr:hypothetical protein [Spirochaetota bacterium]
LVCCSDEKIFSISSLSTTPPLGSGKSGAGLGVFICHFHVYRTNPLICLNQPNPSRTYCTTLNTINTIITIITISGK